ncbi:MAG TPA: hypothetical protein VJR89_39455 [Polyangiales bacterium]|nr:hypothetical protein [Polyangiales bacterium]
MAAPEPEDPQIVPPGKPWVDPEHSDAPATTPVDPHKPWIAPLEPHENPPRPPAPQPPFVE